jgi:hypothetical protein
MRRIHGTDAAMKVARASFLASFEATSNVLAGKVYGLPISGTMAHFYITCFPNEIGAFRAFAATYPEHTVLLLVEPILQAGHLVAPLPDLAAVRARHTQEMARLPEAYQRLLAGETYPVRLSAALTTQQQECETALRQQAL